MKVLSWIIGGAVGGIIGAAIWAGISYASDGREIGYMAWGIGVLARLGVRLAARNAEGLGPGITAAILAVATIAAGKFASVHFLVEKAVSSKLDSVTIFDEDATVPIAADVAKEFAQKGTPLKWPEGEDAESAAEREDFPPEVWAEAEKRYRAMPVAEREKTKAEMKTRRDALLGTIKVAIRNQTFQSSFGPYDIL